MATDMHKIIRKHVAGQAFIDMLDAADISDADFCRISGLSMNNTHDLIEGKGGARLSDMVLLQFISEWPDTKAHMLEIAGRFTESVIRTSSARQARRAHLQEENP
jgi:hypothetical protein